MKRRTVSTSVTTINGKRQPNPALTAFAGMLSDWQRGQLMVRIANGERLIVFNVDRDHVTLAEVEPAKPELFCVYVNCLQHYVLSVNADCGMYYALGEAGWEMVWDSAPNRFAGAKYAADEYGAVVPATIIKAEVEPAEMVPA